MTYNPDVIMSIGIEFARDETFHRPGESGRGYTLSEKKAMIPSGLGMVFTNLYIIAWMNLRI